MLKEILKREEEVTFNKLKLVKTRLQSGVLYYVVFLMLITWIICTSILLVVKLNSIVFNITLLNNTLQDDLQSAVNIICSNPELFKDKDSIEFDLEDNGISRIIAKKKLWGLYKVLQIKAERRKLQKETWYLAGNDLAYQEPIALYMADENKYLSVCGNTFLNGNCYLPRIGVKRGYVEGSSYKGKTIVFGQTKISKSKLPSLDKKAIKLILDFFTNFRPDSFAEIHTITEFHSKYTHINSFSNKTIAFCTEKSLYIENKKLSGNLIICSSKLIRISKSNFINDIIVIAPKVKVDEGFKGNIQIFATDTVLIGRKCQLGYPSVIAALSENTSNIYVRIDEKSRIDGVVVIDKYVNSIAKPILIIAKESEIYGQVYCNGSINTKGDFFGSTFCQNFILNTKSAIYENHLLHTKFDRKKLSPNFCGIEIADSLSMHYGVIKKIP